MTKRKIDFLERLNCSINSVIELYCNDLGQNELSFLKRMYANGISNYIDRLKALKFENYNKVLDVGCGFGQWSIALSLLNKEVNSIDQSEKRIKILNEIISCCDLNNIRTNIIPVEKIPYKSKSFDALLIKFS